MSEPVAKPNTQAVDALYQGIKQLVDSARSQVLTQVNQALVLTYWHIGKTIKTQVLQSERATYGAGVLKQLAERLTQDYGSGFSHSGLTRMAKFFDALPDEAIVATLSQQLSWSHFVELIKLDKGSRLAAMIPADGPQETESKGEISIYVAQVTTHLPATVGYHPLITSQGWDTMASFTPASCAATNNAW